MFSETPPPSEPIPGLAGRELHLFYLLDNSSSMESGGKIAALNDAMRSVLPLLKDENGKPDRQHVNMLLRVITFSTGARWHLQTPTPIEDFQEWEELRPEGTTDFGEALKLLADALENSMPRRALPPCVIVISDGQPTDDWVTGFQRVQNLPWFRKVIRVAIAVGADADKETLVEFTGNSELVLEVNTRSQFLTMLKWASTTITATASRPALERDDGDSGDDSENAALPPPPDFSEVEDPDDEIVF